MHFVPSVSQRPTLPTCAIHRRPLVAGKGGGGRIDKVHMNVENYMDVGFFETHFGTRNRKVKPSVQTVPPLRMKGKKVRLVPADARTQQPDLH